MPEEKDAIEFLFSILISLICKHTLLFAFAELLK